MKKLLLLLCLPVFSFADRLGSLKSDAQVLLTTQAVSGASALGVNYNGVSVTSPTAQINFTGPGVSVVANGSTSTVTISSWPAGGGTTLPLPPGATNYIQNSDILQSGATFYVSSGTVNGNFRVFNTFSSLLFFPGSGGGPAQIYSGATNGLYGLGGTLLNPAMTLFNSGSMGEGVNIGPNGALIGTEGIQVTKGISASTMTITYNAILGSGTINNITSLPVQADASHNLYGGPISLSTAVAGNLPVTNLNSGTSATSSTFWRGDGTWSAPVAGSGASTLAVTTGSTTGWSTIASSPTAVINFDSTTFNVSLKGGATAYVTSISTITAGSIGALTGNQTITISGDSTGSGATAIALTAKAQQANITTLSNSSVTVTGSLLVSSNTVIPGATFYQNGPIYLGSSGYQVQISSNLIISGATFYQGITPTLVAGTNISSITGLWPNQTINAATQSSGGGSILAVTTGSTTGWTGLPISSPTAVVLFDSTTFKVALQGGATAYIATISTITAASLGAVTSVSGTPPINSSGGLTPAISLSQTIGQSETFSGSSVTVASSNGLGVTYGVIAGSVTASNLTSGQCVQTGAGGILTGTGSACGSGGGSGSSSLEILAGVRITSPTATLSFGSGFVGTATTASTATITMNPQNSVITTMTSSQTFTNGGGLTMTYGIVGSTVQFNAFNATVTSVTVTGTGGFAVSNSSAGQIAMTEGSSTTVIPAISGIDTFWADSSSHTFVFNPNNTSTFTISGTSVTVTPGHFLIAGTSIGSYLDGGTGSSSSGGSSSLETLFGTARSSPTATLKGSVDFLGSVTSSTMTISMNPNNTAINTFVSSVTILGTGGVTLNTGEIYSENGKRIQIGGTGLSNAFRLYPSTTSNTGFVQIENAIATSNAPSFAQTNMDLNARTDPSNYYFNPNVYFNAYNPNASPTVKSLFSFGSEGNYSDASTLTLYRMYLWDQVQNREVFHIDSNSANNFIFGSGVLVTADTYLANNSMASPYLFGGFSGTSALNLWSTYATGTSTDKVCLHTGDNTSAACAETINHDQSVTIGSNTYVAGSTFTFRSGGQLGVSRIVWGDGTIQVSSPSAGGGATVMSSTTTLQFKCSALDRLETNFAVNTSTNTNTSNYLTCSFDNATRQYVNGFFMVPSNLDTGGTITIRTFGRSSTAASSKNVGWILEHQPLANGGANGTSYLVSVSSGMAVSATQGVNDSLNWTISVASSTWAANNIVNFRFSRDVSVGNNLASPYYNNLIAIDVPVTTKQ